MLDCQLQDLLERIDRILATDWISLKITNVVIRRQQYFYCVVWFLYRPTFKSRIY